MSYEKSEAAGPSSPGSFSEYFSDEKERMINDCIECGRCAEECPVVSKTDLKDLPSAEIQTRLRACLESSIPDEVAYTRAFSCMECFGCIENVCPVDLNPYLTNLILRHEYRQNGFFMPDYMLPGDPEYPNRVLASIQTTLEEYRRIFTPSSSGPCKTVFFPGCNVYTQPEKILNALDFFDLAEEEFAFVPGLDYCCGVAPLGYGSPRESEALFDSLIDKVMEYEPETLVLWCPTCQCQLEKIVKPFRDVPFEFMTLPQYLTNVANLPPIPGKYKAKITLHEACKSAFTGLDPVGPRKLLERINGLELVEMPRHGKDTSCCGSGAATFFKSALETVLSERMREVESTGAEILVDVCHYCHYLFTGSEKGFGFTTKNYLQILAEVYGITREDKARKWRLWNDVDRVMKDAREFVETSPFSEPVIRSVLESWLTGP